MGENREGASLPLAAEQITEKVRARYAAAATVAASGMRASCCGDTVAAAAPQASCCGDGGTATLASSADPITDNLYDGDQKSAIPEAAVLASLGCGNPTALAELKAGDVVLDLGSGGGIDVLLSAKRVGPTGKAYGLDMTDEMLDLARRNQAESGLENVEFLKGHIESIPLPDASVDVIISNCVINLSADKQQVLREAFRVLKPGGRFAVSDVLVRGHVAPAMRASMEAWVGCLAGALDESVFLDMLHTAGFENPTIEETRVYRTADARSFLEQAGLPVDDTLNDVDGKFFSGFVRAVRPAEH